LLIWSKDQFVFKKRNNETSFCTTIWQQLRRTLVRLAHHSTHLFQAAKVRFAAIHILAFLA